MIDDNQKMFLRHLAIDNDIFHSVFVNPCMMQNQRRSQSGVCLTAHLLIECIMGNYTVRDGAIALKGSHSMGDGRIFLNSLRYSTPTKHQVSKRQVSKHPVSKRLVSKRLVSKRQVY
jgi:hypothetical protein